MLFKKNITVIYFLCGVLFLLMMVGCASVNPVYVNKNHDMNLEVSQVMIMVEYLELKDDVIRYWNFNEDTNIEQQDLLYDVAENMLREKGYHVITDSLKTSGLVVARDFYVDHYVDNKRQDDAIVPPYIIRSIGLDDNNINTLESLLAELTQPITPVLSDYRTFIKNNYKEQTQAIDVSDDTAILVIHSYRPRVSFFSNIDVGFGVSNSGNGAFAGVSNQQPTAKTSAYLIHKGSGEVIWANQTSLIKPKTQHKFFSQLPNK